jgi:hypothetical protein
MTDRLTVAEVRSILSRLISSLPHDACHTCECFQGFLVQLAIDADEGADVLISPLRAARSTLHGCLGCDPCPPGDQYADYRRADHIPASSERGERNA